MSLTTGTRLGTYEIVGSLGAGGMGEVYRATDTRLKRQVAIKVLPASLATDVDRMARFQREAEVLASLNHPHIAGIHGLETDPEGGTFLVMELIEGEDLSQRIARGAIPVDEALPIAKQIADALEAAHEQGIVHRDLKPANIKVRPDGTVKVLDFGLAKAIEGAGAGGTGAPGGSRGEGLSMLPTITSPAMTLMGTILGTAAYMSPEQARGKAVDRRADIWAFGCVLFEMLTGERAFEAEDISLTLVEVMKSEPDWAGLPPIPSAVNTYLRQCLRKDPRQRTQAIGDVRLALEGAFDTPVAPPVSVAAPARPLWKLAVRVVGGVAISAAAGWMLHRPAAPALPAQRVSIVIPPDQSIAFGCSPCLSLAISPDGTRVAYVSTRADAVIGGSVNGPLHIRSIDSREVRELPGTIGANHPFFSPDGQWVGFLVLSGALKKISLAGGSPITVVANVGADGPYSSAAWTENGTMVVSGVEGLRQVRDDGGALVSLTTLNAASGELRHAMPEPIPGTNSVVFTTMLDRGSPGRIEAVNLDGTGRRVVLENATAARYVSSGYLLFRRDGVMLIAPFDAKRLAVTGPAVPLVDDVRLDGPNADGSTPQMVVSRDGTLAYVPGVDPSRTLGIVSRTGAFEPLNVPPDRINRVAVSPDGRAVAFDVSRNVTSEVLVLDLERGAITKLTQTGWSDSQPAWHPDGRALSVVSRAPDGTRGIFLKMPGVTERMIVSDRPSGAPGSVRDSAMAWSADGPRLAYAVEVPARGRTASEIWVSDPTAAQDTHRLSEDPGGAGAPAFSVDGRWFAYVSSNEVYARRFPQGERVQVSTGGGFGPVWRADGKEIFFQAAVGSVPKVMAASVSAQGDRLVVGKPTPLFDMRVIGASGIREQYSSSSIVGRRWDVFPDGQRFLMVRGSDPQGIREIVLVQHWDEELARVTKAK